MSKIQVVVRKVNIAYLEEHYDRLLRELYPARREAVLRLKNKGAAYVSLTAGRLLGDVAERECGISSDKLVIGKSGNGKPYICGREDFRFNISHSGNYVVMAYGNEEVGIDIEQIREKDLAVAGRCFTEAEYDYVLNGYSQDAQGRLESETVNERFFQIWTMKESYLKLTGQGISVPLQSFQVNPHTMSVDNTCYHFDGRGLADYHITVCAEDVSDVVYTFEEGELSCYGIMRTLGEVSHEPSENRYLTP